MTIDQVQYWASVIVIAIPWAIGVVVLVRWVWGSE